LAGPIANFTISLGLDGSVKTQGAGVSAAIDEDTAPVSDAEKDKERLETSKASVPESAKSSADGKLIMAEEIAHGHITWKSMNLLLTGLAGQHPVIFTLILVGGLTIASMAYTLVPWWLGVWGAQYETHNPADVDVT